MGDSEKRQHAATVGCDCPISEGEKSRCQTCFQKQSLQASQAKPPPHWDVAGAIKPPSATHIPFKNAKRHWLCFSIPQQPQLYYSNSVIPDSLRGKYLHRGVLTSAFNCMLTSSMRFNFYFWHNIRLSVQKLNLVYHAKVLKSSSYRNQQSIWQGQCNSKSIRKCFIYQKNFIFPNSSIPECAYWQEYFYE